MSAKAVEGAVASGGDAGVGLVDDAEAGIAAGVGVEDEVGAVLAAVVGAEAFPVGEGLREDGIEAFLQVRRHVVDGHNHGEEGRLPFFLGWRYRVCLWFHNMLSVAKMGIVRLTLGETYCNVRGKFTQERRLQIEDLLATHGTARIGELESVQGFAPMHTKVFGKQGHPKTFTLCSKDPSISLLSNTLPVLPKIDASKSTYNPRKLRFSRHQNRFHKHY